ncbi:MAG: Fic family protein [Kineosporiaceae bacterium]|nr:Fic family protein [Kineosporiaceae bacterium]
MNPDSYTETIFGKPMRRPGGRVAFCFYAPNPLPRTLELSEATILALSTADSSLGHLHGLGQLIRNPQLLVGPYSTREALASSRIEGTNTSLANVMQAEAADGAASVDADVEEVKRYLRASETGYRLLATLPLTQRLIRQAHRELVSGVRGAEKLPGEIRTSPVWIGSPTDSPDSATYVPPLPEYLPELMIDWERFVNEPGRMPVLVRAALMHYQFETIHPFLDGNGRIGRLLVGLMLVQERRLTTPLLYMSGYLEAHRNTYYSLLQGVRERGEIQEWIQFFLTAIARSADDAVHRAGLVVRLREEYLQDAARSRSMIAGLVDLVFTNPYLTVRRVQNHLGITNQGARNLIKDAQARGWVGDPQAIGRGGQLYWVAATVLDILEKPFSYEEVGAETGPVARTVTDAWS